MCTRHLSQTCSSVRKSRSRPSAVKARFPADDTLTFHIEPGAHRRLSLGMKGFCSRKMNNGCFLHLQVLGHEFHFRETSLPSYFQKSSVEKIFFCTVHS
ncbi:hypothetical protein CEXT_727061 [Caerostris extrusa]|uniref:Uncharacterized protein n=1 Tax=Caerostris extrusa TaxID=172846 RepID=A0AAV4NDQ0_CAEEX|nr:hypothetical protein CEXT_727061 [Caerostris extrusa]